VFDLISKRNWFFAFSLLITIPGLLFIILTPLTGDAVGLKFTIDYTGGTRWVVRFQDPTVSATAVKAKLNELGLENSSVVSTSSGFLEIKTIPLGLATPPPAATPPPQITAEPSASAAGSGASGSPAASTSPGTSGSPAASTSPAASSSPAASASPASPSPATTSSPAASGSPGPSASGGASASPSAGTGNTEIPTTGRLGEVASALQEAFGPIAQQNSLTTIGPVVSSDLIGQALVLILVGSLGILLWITFRFRDVKFGVTVVVGIFAILGTVFNVEIDALFVTAMLTVIGFSVHDTIVVFDRIRENKARHAGEPFADIVNHSILQTFGRSITTSFTVVLTLLALLLFGGSATTTFVLALLIGIISGTYSSIFNASPLLVVWQEWEDRRRGRRLATRAPRGATS
jgi:preprotein translocase SecF subunit